MGKHSIAKIPKEMASFLKLPNPELYTGHSYRRSATTIAADNGASIEELKRLGDWKSTSVVERYIQNSVSYKRKISNRISGAINLPSTIVRDQENVAPSVESSVAGGLVSVVARDGRTSLSQSLNNVRIKIPENKDSIIFHFGGVYDY